MTKRNHFLTLAIGIFASYCGAAETIVEHPVLERPTVAIQGGLSFANASTPGDMSSSTSTGLLLGVNVNFPLTPMFSFQP